jgi:hypothetical protein
MFLPPLGVKLAAAALHAVAGATTITASAAGNSTLTGAQKMAVALAAFEQVYEDHCKEVGAPVIPGAAQVVLQRAYDFLDVLPASVPKTIDAVAADAATLAAPAAAVVTAAAPFCRSGSCEGRSGCGDGSCGGCCCRSCNGGSC